MNREPYTGWDPDPLDATPPDPEPPRRLGCSVFVIALIVLLSSLVVPAPRNASDSPAHSGAPLPGARQVGAGIETRLLQRPGGSGLGRAELPRRLDGNATCRDGNWFRNCRVSPTGGAPPSGAVGTVLVGGFATWYDDPRKTGRYAAAGPLIREALGDWRGKTIRVTSGDRSTVVVLSDWCACGERHDWPTLLDLSPAAFADLAPLSQGIAFVEIELVDRPDQHPEDPPVNPDDDRMRQEDGGPVPTLPPTDTAP